MDKLKLSPANLVIVAGGAVMLIASFLAFNEYSTPSGTIGGVHYGGTVSSNVWGSGYFLIATIPALLGIVMAAQVGITAWAPGFKLSTHVLGLSWNQIHLVLAFQATIMMVAFLVQDTGRVHKGIGLFLMLIAAIALLAGAILRMQEHGRRPRAV